jgi:hypothetical protein
MVIPFIPAILFIALVDFPVESFVLLLVFSRNSC